METLRSTASEHMRRETLAERWTRVDQPAAQAEIADSRAVSAEACYERNIENYIGTVRVPIGLAGPLRIRGLHADGDYNVPLATTEATLVASYARGMRVISDAGGCVAAMIDERLERTPAFFLSDLRAALALSHWIRENTVMLAAAAERTSRFAQSVTIEPIVEGNHLYLICGFTTGAAAGQNMVTIATEALCAQICEHAPMPIARYVVEANLSGDKKATHRSLAGTRGKRVSAEVVVPRAVALARLHVSPDQLAEYWQLGAIGSAMSGAVGIQGHIANGLTALALATGQDVACVAESAVGITRFSATEKGDCYASVTLPNVVVGTVGGGTALPTQRAALQILAQSRPLTANAFAEIVAGVALAGELSISAAICAGEFTAAHRRFARGVHAS